MFYIFHMLLVGLVVWFRGRQGLVFLVVVLGCRSVYLESIDKVFLFLVGDIASVLALGAQFVHRASKSGDFLLVGY